MSSYPKKNQLKPLQTGPKQLKATQSSSQWKKKVIKAAIESQNGPKTMNPHLKSCTLPTLDPRDRTCLLAVHSESR